MYYLFNNQFRYAQQADRSSYMYSESNGHTHIVHDVPSHVQQPEQYTHPAHPQLHHSFSLPQAIHQRSSSLVFQQPLMQMLPSAPQSAAMPSSVPQLHTVQTNQQPGKSVNINSSASHTQNHTEPVLLANKNHIQLPYFTEASRNGSTLVAGQQRSPTEHNNPSQVQPPATGAAVPHTVIQLEERNTEQSAQRTRGSSGMNPPPSSDQVTSQTTRPPQSVVDGVHFAAGAQAPRVENQTADPSTPVEQFAGRHASNILEKATSYLNDFLEAQRNLVRNELLRLNSKYIQDVSTLQGELRKVRQAEQEAREEKERIVRACENIVAQALKWKDSLQDTARKFAVLQHRHWNLAQLALRQNKLLYANSSGSEKDVAMVNRILESSKTYDDTKSRNEANASSTTNGSSADLDGTYRISIKVKDEKDKLRVQNEINIVSEILERKPKVESPGHGSTVTENHKSETSSTEIKDVTPYIIDLTVDPSCQNGVPASPSARFLDPPKDPTQAAQKPISSSRSGTPRALESSHSAVVLPTEGDGLKRSMGTDDADNRARKRHCPEDPPLIDFDGNVKSQPDLTSSERNVEPASNREAKNREDSDKIADETGIRSPPAKNSCSDDLQPKNFDALHLLLIYHKDEAGTNGCRFCLVDQRRQGSDKTMVFPATVTDDALVEHALTCHREDIVHVLQMTKAELFTAYSKMCQQN